MITRVNHVSFTVSDLERAIAFYRDALGLEQKSRVSRTGGFVSQVIGMPDAHLEIAHMGAGNCTIELIQYVAPLGVKIDTRTCNVGSAHVCFNVDDFQGMLRRVEAGGGRVVGEPSAIPSGLNAGRFAVYVEDPDNNTIEFVSNQIQDELKAS
jgi:catechol 2,3-dioxygenase-like lactoylglutathione lyase family enzyme